jgi:glycosyltransferase involved in cell wall biosynthesis
MAQSEVNNNILYMSYDGMTDPLGQSQVIPYLEGLAKNGYRFTLISFEKPERFNAFKTTIALRLKESEIEWVPLIYTRNPPVLSTLWDLFRLKKKAYALLKKKQFKVVHCRSYITALIGLQLKRQKQVKFVFDMRGFYADERLDGAIWSLGNHIYRMVYNFFKRKEKEFLSNADYTISLTQKAKGIIHTWKEVKNQPVLIEVIPCCADLELFSKKNIDEQLLATMRKEYGLNANQFVLSYLGSIGTWYLLDEMLDFFKCLLDKRADAKFFFITTEEPAAIKLKARQRNIPDNAIIIRSATHKQIPALLALSDWSIFFIKPVFSKSASSPTKQGEIMGMGIPHVCNAGVGDVDSIVDEKSGVLIRSFNAQEYNKAIEVMLHTSFDAAYIESKAKDIYSLSRGVAGYRSVYETILNQ